MFITLGKLVTVLAWLYGIAAFVCPQSVPYATWAQIVLVIIALAHVVEILILAPKLEREDGNSRTYHALRIFVFGVFHTLSVRARTQASK